MEKEKRLPNPAIEQIYSVVDTIPSGKRSLKNIESSLRRSPKKTGKEFVPIVTMGHAVLIALLTPIRGLDGETPIISLVKAVAKETAKPVPTEITIFPKDSPLEGKPSTFFIPTEHTQQKRPPQVDMLVRDGDLYISPGALVKKGYNVSYDKIRELLAEVPSVPGIAPNGKDVPLYNAIKAEKIIAGWKDERDKKLSRHKETSRGLDESIWADSYELSNIYDISTETIKKLLANAAITTYRRKKYFLRQEAAQTLIKYISEKSTTEGIYYRDGEARITIGYLNKRTGFSYDLLRKKLEDIHIGVDEASGLYLYSLEKSLGIVNAIKSIPQVDKETKMYVDEEGTAWAVGQTIRKQFKVSNEKFDSYVENVPTIPVRALSGQVKAGYKVDTILANAANFLAIPHAENFEKDYQWASEIAADYNISDVVVHSLFQGMSIQVRGSSKGKMKYPRETVNEVMTDLLAFPEIDQETNLVTSRSGEEYAVPLNARRKLRMSGYLFDRALEEGDIAFMIARKGTEFFITYKLADLVTFRQTPRESKPRPQVVERNWKEEIETEVQALLSPETVLTADWLKKEHPKMSNRIAKKYPGGVRALRLALGIENTKAGNAVEKKTKKERISWESMSEREMKIFIENEAKKAIAAGSLLTADELRKHGFNGLAVYAKRYPGGLAAIRENVGQKETVKRKTNWKKIKDPATEIRTRVAKIMENNNGDFTSKDLMSQGLWGSIERYYPGGNNGLRVDLGLEIKKKAVGDWTAATVLAEAAAIRNQYGEFSYTLLKEIGRLDVYGAARTKYPGGPNMLVKDLGVKINRKKWDNASIEEEALKLYKSYGTLSSAILDEVSGLRIAVYKKYPDKIAGLMQKCEGATKQ